MGASLKIGFITERMLRGFGVDLVVDQVARGLAARGHDVTVYASVSDSTLDSESYRLRLIPTRTSTLFPCYDLAAQRYLPFLNQEGNDIYFIETFPYFSLLPRLKTPAVAVDHGVSSTEGFPLKIRANFAYVRFTQQLYLRYARHIVTVSEYLKSTFPGRLREKTMVIHNGADHYPPGGNGDELRRRLGVAGDDVLLLYVGRLSSADQPYKGTAELSAMYRRLVREIPRLKLLMVGFGGERERRWLEEQGVLVVTNAPAEQMPEIFAACDAYVTASRWEGFDLPVVEAQSFGKPVVALDIGAHGEVVARDRSGFLAADMESLAAAVRRLADDNELRRRMGMAALDHAADFTWSRAVDRYEQLLEKVI